MGYMLDVCISLMLIFAYVREYNTPHGKLRISAIAVYLNIDARLCPYGCVLLYQLIYVIATRRVLLGLCGWRWRCREVHSSSYQGPCLVDSTVLSASTSSGSKPSSRNEVT